MPKSKVKTNAIKLTLLLSSIAILISCNTKFTKKAPKATKGVIDVANWDFNIDGPLELSGEWQFYWGNLVSPNELKKNVNVKYLKAPGQWNNYKTSNSEDDSTVGSTGYGTYVLEIKGLKKKYQGQLALASHKQGTAYKAFFVGDIKTSKVNPILAGGIVGKNAEKHIAQYSRKVSNRLSLFKRNYIIVQISNYNDKSGGMWNSITLGEKQELEEILSDSKDTNLIVVGILLMMFLYHIGLYKQRKEDSTSLYFGLFCLIVGMRFIVTEQLFFNFFNTVSKVNFELIYKIEFITVYISSALLIQFINNVFPNESIKAYGKIKWAFAGTFTLITVVFNSNIYTVTHQFYHLVLLISVIYIIYVNVRAIRSLRTGSLLSALGLSFLMLASIHDILVAAIVLHGVFLTPYALVLFIFCKSFIISKLFAKAYEDLERTTKENISLEELDKHKTKFFQNISHEIRTPLTLIINTIEQLQGHMKDDHFLKTALRNSKRLYRLVNQLLDFQKVKSIKTRKTLSIVNINSFLNTIGESFAASCIKKDIEFRVNIEQSMEYFIRADVDYLEKIVFNYLSNALKYTPQSGSIALYIEESDNYIRVSVKDSGVGIPSSKTNELFKVFSQIDDSAINEHEGTGLGLALVKELTEMLEGRVGVESDVAFGSTFWAEFPIFRAQKQLFDFLIIDDEIEIIHAIEDLIQTNFDSPAIMYTESGVEAKTILQEHEFKCIICDLNLPKIDGIELLKHVDSKYPKSKKILVTGEQDIQKITHATNEANANKILLKPVEHKTWFPILSSTLAEFNETEYNKTYDLFVIDDDSAILNSMEGLIIEANRDTKYNMFTDVERAKESLRNFNVKCVVSDLNMGVNDGITLLKHVKEVSPDTQRVIVTGEDTKSIPKELITKAEIHKIFDKPLNRVTIEKILDLSEKSNVGSENALVDLSSYKPKDWHTAALDFGNDGSKNLEFLEGPGEKILVVDDVYDMRHLIAKMLQKSGFKVKTAENGFEGLKAAKDFEPDLMIIDWVMPKMTGIELLDALKKDKDTTSIPTILLTAKTDQESRLIGGKVGASAYIGKPFNELEIISIITNLLRLKSREKEIMNLNREISENILQRFLPPPLVDDIVSGSKSIHEKHKLETITVLFCDICSFTKASEDLGPRAMANYLNFFFEKVNDVIFEHGGTIDKIIGDSVMAIWGAPTHMNPLEQVLNAQKCALELHLVMNNLHEIHKDSKMPKLNVRVGINHGPAIVGFFGSERKTDYTAIGGTINTAQRIEGVAAPGEILVSGVVRDLLPDNAKWSKAGDFKLKGLGKTQVLYRVIS